VLSHVHCLPFWHLELALQAFETIALLSFDSQTTFHWYHSSSSSSTDAAAVCMPATEACLQKWRLCPQPRQLAFWVYAHTSVYVYFEDVSI
jgi:hypothetical protein